LARKLVVHPWLGDRPVDFTVKDSKRGLEQRGRPTAPVQIAVRQKIRLVVPFVALLAVVQSTHHGAPRCRQDLPFGSQDWHWVLWRHLFGNQSDNRREVAIKLEHVKTEHHPQLSDESEIYRILHGGGEYLL